MEKKKNIQIITFDRNGDYVIVQDKNTKEIVGQIEINQFINKVNKLVKQHSITEMKKRFINGEYFTYPMFTENSQYYINIHSQDKYYNNEFRNLYIQLKHREQKIANLKIFRTKVTAFLLVAASIAGYGKLLSNHDKKLMAIINEGTDIMQENPDIDSKLAHEMAHTYVSNLEELDREEKNNSDNSEHVVGSNESLDSYYLDLIEKNPGNQDIINAYNNYLNYTNGYDEKESSRSK